MPDTAKPLESEFPQVLHGRWIGRVHDAAMRKSFLVGGSWVAANFAGIGVFLALASRSWIEPELADMPGASAGDAFVWAYSALPVPILFFLFHFVGASIALACVWRDRRWNWAAFVSATSVCWIATLLFDGAHHGV